MDEEIRKKIIRLRNKKVSKSMTETQEEIKSKSSKRSKEILDNAQVTDIRTDYYRGFGFGVSNVPISRTKRRKHG